MKKNYRAELTGVFGDPVDGNPTGVMEEAGYEAMIYLTSYAGYIKYDLSQVMEYGFWFAQYSDTPDFYYDFQMWQYSSTGSVDGISGDVDLNLQLNRTE